MPTENPIQVILDHYAAGHRAVMISGRSLHDVEVDELAQIRPLRQTLFRVAHEQHGMAVVTVNLAQGALLETPGQTPSQRTETERVLREAGINVSLDARQLPHERTLGLLNDIYRAATESESLPALLVCVDFVEDLAPGGNAQASDFMLQITEVLWLLAHEFRLRRHPVFLIFTGLRESIDCRVTASLKEVRLTQPGKVEKLALLAAMKASELRKSATFESGLDDDAVASLSAHTPNRSLEQLCFGSARSGWAITRMQLIERRRDDIVTMSDGTLRLLDTSRLASSRLTGRMITPVLAILSRWAERLRKGDTAMPTNLLLCGSPSSGKTDVALLMALLAGVPAVEMASPKGSFVGETERRAKLQWRIFKELSPVLGFIDEITEQWGLRRNQTNLDSGATDAMQGAMLEALSDVSRSGKNLIVGTTNCPWRLGAAQETRWTILPVLSALPEDYPAIIAALLQGMSKGDNFDPQDRVLLEAARLFADKGTPPRNIRSALSIEASLRDGPLTPERVRHAAVQIQPLSQKARISSEYADLAAISQCTTAEFLPWAQNLAEFPFPIWLKPLVDTVTGQINSSALDARMAELAEQTDV